MKVIVDLLFSTVGDLTTLSVTLHLNLNHL